MGQKIHKGKNMASEIAIGKSHNDIFEDDEVDAQELQADDSG